VPGRATPVDRIEPQVTSTVMPGGQAIAAPIRTSATQTRVSVIIPTRNRHRLLEQAIRSAQALAGDGLEVEVIVGDNQSTDETAQVCDARGVKRVVAKTLGPAAARNAAMRVATGEYIAFLDDDDAYLPSALKSHLLLLASDPTLGAASSQVLSCDPEFRPIRKPYPERAPRDGRAFGFWLRHFPQVGSLVVRRSAAEEIGEFDETLIAAEDWDWNLRLALKYRVGFFEEPCVLLRERAVGLRTTVDEERVPYMWKVYLRNLRRAGSERPSLWYCVRTITLHLGKYVDYFVGDAEVMLAAHEVREARHALSQALKTSPAHLFWNFLRYRRYRHVVYRAVGLQAS
jgi:glycosyltransferase involved in cell wall biosynthesis